MSNVTVTVVDGNNVNLEVVPQPNVLVTIDRGIVGPPGPPGPGDVNGPSSSTDNAVARFDGTTGKLIQNSTVLIDDSGNITQPLSVTMANGAGTTVAAGRMWYDNTTGSWNLGMGGGNITQQVGEELFVYGKASAAITDSPLQIVYQTGTVGSSGVITFAPTVAGITDGSLILGAATESLALNSFGRITSFGVIHGVTTNGTAYGETWADGDTIWYNPVTGNPTKVKPSAPNIKVSIGTVIKAGPGGSGSIQIEINHGSVLGGTDSNVQITSVANGNLLTYDSTAGYWKNSNTLPGTYTLSGGTANGVAYLNGSKVVTTGTALTFDGTNFATTGTASATKLIPTGGTTTGNGMYLPATNTLGWSVNGAEAMRLDGNLLVGTTTNTNSSKLVVNGTISETVSSTQYLVASQYDVGTAPNKIPLNQYLGNLAYQDASNIAGQVGFSLGTAALPSITFSTNTNTGMWSPATNVVAWSTNGSERMRVDAFGNLLAGLTSPLYGTTNRVQINANGSATAVVSVSHGGLASQSGYMFWDGTNLQLANNSASGALIFGTASAAEKMRLDSAGNLGIGTSSPGAKLNVVSSGTASYSGANILASTSTANGYFLVGRVGATATSDFYAYSDATSTQIGNEVNKSLQLVVNSTSRATLDTSGNLLVGLASATGTAKLQVSGPLRTTGYTVATLPAGTVGMRTYVTDALAPSFGATVVGGGAVTIPVFYNGTNWIVA